MTLVSVTGNLHVMCPVDWELWSLGWEWPEWTSEAVDPQEESSLPQIKWIWSLFGMGIMGIGVFTLLYVNYLIILIPYWAVVLPITVLSARLLLGKLPEKTPVANEV